MKKAKFLALLLVGALLLTGCSSDNEIPYSKTDKDTSTSDKADKNSSTDNEQSSLNSDEYIDPDSGFEGNSGSGGNSENNSGNSKDNSGNSGGSASGDTSKPNSGTPDKVNFVEPLDTDFICHEQNAYMFIEGYTGKATSVKIPSTIRGLPVAQIRGFKNSNVENVIISDGILSIGEDAFANSKLKSIDIPDSVTKIDPSAFKNTPLFSEIESKNSPFVIINNYLIYVKFDKSNTDLVIPNGVTKIFSVYGEGIPIFEGYTSITIPNSVTMIGDGAFINCEVLKSIEIPDSVTYIGYNAFSGCEKLESIKLSKNITRINGWTFTGCNKLKSIEIPDGVTYIGDEIFRGCYSLKSVAIPDSVTEIETGDGLYTYGAFYNCTIQAATYKGKTYDYNHINDLYKAINGN